MSIDPYYREAVAGQRVKVLWNLSKTSKWLSSQAQIRLPWRLETSSRAQNRLSRNLVLETFREPKTGRCDEHISNHDVAKKLVNPSLVVSRNHAMLAKFVTTCHLVVRDTATSIEIKACDEKLTVTSYHLIVRDHATSAKLVATSLPDARDTATSSSNMARDQKLVVISHLVAKSRHISRTRDDLSHRWKKSRQVSRTSGDISPRHKKSRHISRSCNEHQ